MKVFISHSTYDKWVARQISEQLARRGFETFLDEKDIKTGDSIDESVQTHLKECDELLVVISPASLKSQWVFIEIGGAKALGKRIVPILFHVETNELPQPIAKHLAKDINAIASYYDELSRRASGKPPKPEPAQSVVTEHQRTIDGFAEGDRVRISDVDRVTTEDKAASPKWVPEMDKYDGAETKIIFIDWRDDHPERQVKLAADAGKHWWATRWLRHLETLEGRVAIKDYFDEVHRSSDKAASDNI